MTTSLGVLLNLMGSEKLCLATATSMVSRDSKQLELPHLGIRTHNSSLLRK